MRSGLGTDILHAERLARLQPRFASAAVALLALGIDLAAVLRA
jgi:hypothetical protein